MFVTGLLDAVSPRDFGRLVLGHSDLAGGELWSEEPEARSSILRLTTSPDRDWRELLHESSDVAPFSVDVVNGVATECRMIRTRGSLLGLRAPAVSGLVGEGPQPVFLSRLCGDTA